MLGDTLGGREGIMEVCYNFNELIWNIFGLYVGLTAILLGIIEIVRK